MRRFRATIVAVEKHEVLHNVSVCVCSLRYPACNAHAMYYNVICDLPASTEFFHIVIKGTIFGETLLNVKRVPFIFPTNLSGTFFHYKKK